MMRTVGFATCRAWPEISDSDALVARALERRGARVIARPWNDPAASAPGLDALVLRSCWDYHHDAAAFDAWLDRLEREHVPVWNPPGLARWNTSKRYLVDLRQAGVPVPETVVLGGEAPDLARIMDARGWSQAVVKPLVSASGHDTRLVYRADADETARALAAGAIRRPALVQAFVEEIRTRGEWSLVFVERTLTHAVLKTPAPHDFRVQPRLGGRAERGDPPAPVRAAAVRALAAAAGDALYARVDVVEAAAGPLLMELELVEPGLFFTLAPEAADVLAAAIARRLGA